MARDGIDLSRRADVTVLTEWMDEPCSREVMRACLEELGRLNRWFLGYRPVLDWLGALDLRRFGRPVRILDVGCGYGDTLRRIEAWARGRSILVELTGMDLNPDAIAIAAEATQGGSSIRWIAGDVFGYRGGEAPDLVMSSLFTHHLSDAEVARFVHWMEKTAAIGWLVNDLSRASVPYHLFGWFARVMRLHPFVQHDGPVSFARAFQPEDWRRLCGAAGLAQSAYRIQAYQPARLCVSRIKEARQI
jgi:SAM-dependent methyltransferase